MPFISLPTIEIHNKNIIQAEELQNEQHGSENTGKVCENDDKVLVSRFLRTIIIMMVKLSSSSILHSKLLYKLKLLGHTVQYEVPMKYVV